MRIEGFDVKAILTKVASEGMKADTAGLPARLLMTDLPYLLEDTNLENLLQELTARINGREQTLQALPVQLRAAVKQTITQQLDYRELLNGGRREWTAASRRIVAELSHLIHSLSNDKAALPPEAAREWAQLATPAKEHALSSFHDLLQSFRDIEKLQSRSEPSANSAVFLLPLYFETEKDPYPAYIHIYREPAEAKAGEPPTSEIWLRICLATENLGLVETAFHLGRSGLDVRMSMKEETQVLPDAEVIRDLLADVPLTVNQIFIRGKQAGGR